MDTEHLYKTLKDVVISLDTNEDGVIDVDEFRHAYFKLNPTGDEATMKKVFQEIDADGSKAITLDELAQHYGFTFSKDGKLQSKMDTDKLETDEQVLELFQLKAIAADLEKELEEKDTKRSAAIRRKAHEAAIEKKANESRRFSMVTQLHHGQELRRRNSKTTLGAPSVKEIQQFATVQRHASTAEFELLDACTIGDYDVVDKLIAQGVNVNVCDDKGQSALHKVCRIGGSHAVAVCVAMAAKDVEIDFQDKNGKTALHYAAEYGHDDLVEWLLAKDADPTVQSLDGWFPLHEACFKNAKRCIELLTLTAKKPDINGADVHGRTALHIASYRCDTAILEFLVTHGADPSLQDMDHHDAADLAKRTGRRNSREYLEGLAHKGDGAKSPGGGEGMEDLIAAAVGSDGVAKAKAAHGKTNRRASAGT
mmetsp:Transcript_103/g.398  ORF Transcript_103/g.398 Transcript_103/m.398 type:complete len:424 (-) Transcript_103:505-1776(-)